MENSDAKLRVVLAFLVTILKSQARTISEISSELAAVTGAVKGLDPTFYDVLERSRQDANEALDPVRRAQLDQYDELLRSIENGEIV